MTQPGRGRVDFGEDGDAQAHDDDDDLGNWLTSEPSPDAVRRRNRTRRAGRARSRARRYAVANRLHVHVTLTFGHDRGGMRLGPRGRRVCAKEVATFVKALTRQVGRMPFLYTLEQNETGGGWHVHMLLPRRLSADIIGKFWRNGRVFVTDIALDSRFSGRPMKDRMMAAADIGSGYLSKRWSEMVLMPGDHLYEVAQGFAPKQMRGECADLGEAFARVRMLVGGRDPTTTWGSSDSAGWVGPPVYVLRWVAWFSRMPLRGHAGGSRAGPMRERD